MSKMSNKSNGSIRDGLWLRGKVYHYRFSYRGVIQAGSTRCRDRGSAMLFLTKLRSKLLLEEFDIRKGVKKCATFKEAFDLWLDARGPRVAEETVKQMLVHWRCRLRLWANIPLEELQPHIDRLYGEFKQGHAPSTQRELFVKIKSVLTFAHERGLTQKVFDIPEIKVPRRPKEVLDEAELRLFFETLDKNANLHQQVMIRAMYYLGLREQEAFRLKFDNWDPAKRTYTIDRQKNGDITVLPVHQEMAEWFAKLPREEGQVYMCPRKDRDEIHGKNYTFVPLKKAIAAAGLSPRICHHRLRASLATKLLNDGIPLAMVQKIMRHSSPQTTMQYYFEVDLNLMREALNQAALKEEGPEPEPLEVGKVVPFKNNVG